MSLNSGLLLAGNSIFSKTFSTSEKFENQFLIIDNSDTVVFDFSQAICTPLYVQVPVFYLSDDDIYALDFALKFNPSEFTYNSTISHKPYLNNSTNYNPVDSTLRFSTFSMTVMDNNTPLISVRFNVTSGMISLSSFSTIQTWLNGDVCSYKSINIQPAPPIVSGGITSIVTGDSLQLNIFIPAGHTNVWNTGATTSSIYIHNSGVYSVAVTNLSGCTSTSYITISAIDPLPVELISFEGKVADAGIELNWKTASELNNDYFILEHSSVNLEWKKIGKINGAGTTSNEQQYKFFHNTPFKNENYYRIKQVDFDGKVSISEAIRIFYNSEEEPAAIHVYPNPATSEVYEITVSILSNHTEGSLNIYDLSGNAVYTQSVILNNSKTLPASFKVQLPLELQPGIYLIVWTDEFSQAASKLVIH